MYSSVDKKQEEVFRPYLVRVEISDLNIRKKPGTARENTGKYTGVGSFIIVDEALHCGGGRGVKPFFVRAKPCLPLWSFSLIRKTELLVAFNITSGIEVSFFSAKSRTLLIYRYYNMNPERPLRIKKICAGFRYFIRSANSYYIFRNYPFG